MAEKDFRVKKGLQVEGTGDSSIAGNLGIGTTSPDYALDVAGNIGVDNIIYHNGDGNTYLNFQNDDFRIVVGNDLAFHYDESGSSIMHLSYNGEADVNIGNGHFFFGGSQGSYDARMGIGTTTPNVPLEIKGIGTEISNTVAGYKSHLLIVDQSDYNAAYNGGAILFGGKEDTNDNVGYWAKVSGEKANTSENNFSGTLNFWTRKHGATGPTQRMVIDEDGNVGIGTDSPDSKLDISHSSSPTLTIQTTATNSQQANLTLHGARNAENTIGQITFSNIDDTDNPDVTYNAARILAFNDGGLNAGGIKFQTVPSGSSTTLATAMTITENSRVGIGNTDPGTKLDVTGDISAKDTGASGGVGYHMQNSEGQFLLYTDDGHLVVKDFAGSATYPFKIMGTAQNDTLVVNTGGDVTVKDDLTVNGHINFDTQHVGGSAGGATGTENGANTWCKILEWDHGTTQFRDLSLTLGITEVDVGSQNQAIIAVYGRSHATNNDLTMGVKIISLISAVHLRDDSFKIINNGWGTPIQLWMKKYGTYGTFNWNEIAKKVGSSTTLTYSSNSAWQSTEPASTANPVQELRSYGTVIEGRQPVLNLYHNQNVSQLSAGDVLSTISFRKHTSHGGNESIRIYNVQGDSGSSGASDDYHTSDLRISTRKIGTDSYFDRFTILGQEGYVGIGTTSPAVPLHVGSGNNEAARFLGSGNDAFIKIQEPTGSENVVLGSTGGTGFVGSGSNNTFAIRANNSNKMFVTSAGNVGIGVSEPTDQLCVRGGIKIGEFNDSDGTGYASSAAPNSGNLNTGAGDPQIRVSGRSTGNPGIIQMAQFDANNFFGGTTEFVLGRLQYAMNENVQDVTTVAEIRGITSKVNDPGHFDGALTFLTSQGDGSGANLTEKVIITADGNVGIGTMSPASALHVVGHIQATTKSFVIDHPSKEGMTLRHGSLEGPEHAVYIRGQTKGNLIDLPDYWSDLVDEDSITVQLTPKLYHQNLYVRSVDSEKVVVGSSEDTTPEFYYLIHAERKDVDKMVVEY